MTGLAHDGFHSFAAVEHGSNVQVHNLLEILRIVLAERRTGGDTGVIHQNIRAAEGVCHLLYGILHCRKVRQVRPQAHNLPLVIFRFQSGQGFLHGLLTAAEKSDPGSVLEKHPHGSQTDAPGPSGDDGGFSL